MWTRFSSTRSERTRRALAVLLSAVAVFVGCFEPRDPLEPCRPGIDANCRTPVPLEVPLTAEIARDNIIKALRKRGTDGPNIKPNYELSLDPLFFYEPDADALAASSQRSCQPFFDPWLGPREVQFMQLVLELGGTGLAVPDTVDLVVPVFERSSGLPDPNLARYNVQYTLTLKFAASGVTPRRVECYSARALWDFKGVTDNNFLLIRWEDVESLRDIACPGGIASGSIGILRALEGPCP